MAKPISVQLYSVRDQLKEDYAGTIEKIAKMGYVGVEPFSVSDDPAAEAKLYADNGLVATALQAGIPIGDDTNKLLDAAEALGLTNIVCPYYNHESFTSIDGIKTVCDKMLEGAANAAKRGMTVGYHNHDFELQLVDGKPALLHMFELCGKKVFYTIDTYWVTVGGQDAVEIVTTLGDQVNVLHIKDGPLDKSKAMLAAGAGKMNFPPIVDAAKAAQWLVVEIDRCDTDMMEAIRQSIDYLTRSGLGEGK